MSLDTNQLQRMLSLIVESAGGQVRFPGFPLGGTRELADSRLDVHVIPAGSTHDLPIPEPSDLKFVGNVSALPAIASGVAPGGFAGTEVKFNADGIVIPIPGAIGAFWSRSLQNRWASVQPGRPIAYDTGSGLIFASDSAVQASGQLALEFYARPPNEHPHSFYKRVREWTAQSSEGGAGSVVNTLNSLILTPIKTQVSVVACDGTDNQIVTPPAGTTTTDVSYVEGNAADVLVTDANGDTTSTSVIKLGSGAPLAAAVFNGTGNIKIHGANTDSVLFIFHKV